MDRVLELGPSPLANAFPGTVAEFATERRYPLDLYLCSICGLVQLLDVIDPEVLFRHYVYVTGTSRTMADHFDAYADAVTIALCLRPEDLVIEIASNDGSLLEAFQRRGVKTLGVEPARNIAALARGKGIETLDLFFGRETAAEVRAHAGSARVVVCNNVLAHVDDPAGFLAGAVVLLSADGTVVIEVPYVGELVDRLEYDTVYHEHLCYFALGPLAQMCESVGLAIHRVDQVPVHGGSLRVWAGHRAHHGDHAEAVHGVLATERAAGLYRLDRWHQFARDVARSREELLALLERERAAGKKLAAYGAPAKGNTLLNYCGIAPELIPYTVDRNRLKVDRFTPGMHIPVRKYEGTYTTEGADVALLLAWNMADEIMSQPQERSWREAGGRFVLPLPRPRVV